MPQNAISPWNLYVRSLNKYPDNKMVIYQNKEMTYQQMLGRILELSTDIMHFEDKMFGIFLPNCIDYVALILALNKNNKVIVPLSAQLKGDSLFERINYSDIEIVITNKKGFEEIIKVKDKINLKAVGVLNDQGNLEWHELQYRKVHIPQIKEDTFAICFTSGSTSKPKAVVISNKAITGNAYAIAEFFHFKDDDRFLAIRPFAQAGPIVGDILMPLSGGGSIVILNDLFHPGIFLKAIQENKVTSTLLVTTMVSLILDYPNFDRFDSSSLKKVIFGGMTMPRTVVLNALEKLPKVNFYNTYGLTETCTKVSYICLPEIANLPESVGVPIRGCDMKIYREDGSEADIGEQGEIYVISDYMMDGYYKREDLTRETLTEKGMRTRDVGYKDENGHFYIVGRNDDLIIQGGNNVFPIEVEEILVRHPAIKEAVVFGADEPKLGKKIVALVCKKAGHSVEVQEISRFCRANMEDKKVPKEIYIVDDIKRNDVDKVSRNEMRAFYYENILKKSESNNLQQMIM